MKRLLTFLLLFLISVLLPLGCTLSHSDSTGMNSSSERILSIYNWSTYIDPEIIKQFEKKFGITVQYDTYESNDDLYAKLKPGNPGYDVIFPSDYMVAIMGKENLLEVLNLKNIPNIKNIDQKFLVTPFDPGNQYSLPYQWGTMGLGYNIKATGVDINSWGAIFDPKYNNRVALIDELRSMMGGILIYLGYDPNTVDPDKLSQVKDYILKHKDTIAAFAPDTGQLLLDQGQVDIAVEWSGDIFQVMKENPNLRYVIPKEGSIVWLDNISIPKNAPHKALAEKFINFILEPEVSAKISNFIRYGTPNKTAIEMGLINPEDLKNPAIYPPPEVFKRLTYIRDVGSVVKLYDRVWTEIKLGIGQ
jgi:spermidine/putrescine transport system substrate-binding protein